MADKYAISVGIGLEDHLSVSLKKTEGAVKAIGITVESRLRKYWVILMRRGVLNLVLYRAGEVEP